MNRVSKWLLSILALFLLPVVVVCIAVWQENSDRQENLVELTTQRAKLEGIVTYGKSLTSTVPTTGLAGDHLIGPDDTPTLRAELQSNLKAMAAQHGLQVFQASEDETEVIDGPLKRVRLRLELSGVWTSALQFLQDIESHEKWLFVDNLTLRSSEQEGIQSTSEPQVQISIAISGLVAPNLLAAKP
jgi:Tfp pilus assembly protein PilO